VELLLVVEVVIVDVLDVVGTVENNVVLVAVTDVAFVDVVVLVIKSELLTWTCIAVV
jgi:hypothetical protein